MLELFTDNALNAFVTLILSKVGTYLIVCSKKNNYLLISQQIVIFFLHILPSHKIIPLIS